MTTYKLLYTTKRHWYIYRGPEYAVYATGEFKDYGFFEVTPYQIARDVPMGVLVRCEGVVYLLAPATAYGKIPVMFSSSVGHWDGTLHDLFCNYKIINGVLTKQEVAMPAKQDVATPRSGASVTRYCSYAVCTNEATHGYDEATVCWFHAGDFPEITKRVKVTAAEDIAKDTWVTKEQVATSEAVDHPQHYGGGDNPYETIKVIEAWNLDFCLGNAVKYISRAGKKNAQTELEDLKKAEWYIQRRISQLAAKS